ncbi:hypothetical protein V8C86DRAFT_2507684 [Haematococcus lacustris]
MELYKRQLLVGPPKVDAPHPQGLPFLSALHGSIGTEDPGTQLLLADAQRQLSAPQRRGWDPMPLPIPGHPPIPPGRAASAVPPPPSPVLRQPHQVARSEQVARSDHGTPLTPAQRAVMEQEVATRLRRLREGMHSLRPSTSDCLAHTVHAQDSTASPPPRRRLHSQPSSVEQPHRLQVTWTPAGPPPPKHGSRLHFRHNPAPFNLPSPSLARGPEETRNSQAGLPHAHHTHPHSRPIHWGPASLPGPQPPPASPPLASTPTNTDAAAGKSRQGPSAPLSPTPFPASSAAPLPASHASPPPRPCAPTKDPPGPAPLQPSHPPTPQLPPASRETAEKLQQGWTLTPLTPSLLHPRRWMPPPPRPPPPPPPPETSPGLPAPPHPLVQWPPRSLSPSPYQGSLPRAAMALPAPTQGKDEGAVAAAAGQRTSQSQGQRWLRTHTLAAHARHRPEEVSRGQVFNEFNAMDFWHTGKLTLAQLEDEGLALGLQPHHITSLYSRLDPKAQGFFTIKDWGRPQLSQQVRELVRLAERRKRGPGTVRTPDVEVTNPTLAIQLALFKLQLRVNGRHQPSHEQLLQAFTFIDTDNSGMLSRDELEDAFHGLNINVTPQVVDQMMRQFDEDGDGRIQYREFLHALFPIVSSARR